MQHEWTQVIMVVIQGFIAVIFMGAIPWAFKVHGRLCAIEANLGAIAHQAHELEECFARIGRLERQIAAMRGREGNGD